MKLTLDGLCHEDTGWPVGSLLVSGKTLRAHTAPARQTAAGFRLIFDAAAAA